MRATGVLHKRRGFIAITFSLIMLLLVFTIISTYTLLLVTGSMQVRRAEKTAQALYAAEAGLQVAVQTGQQGTTGGSAGRCRYVVRRSGDELVALGAAEQATGVSATAAVAANLSGGRVANGTWRQARRGEYPDLRARLAPAPAAAQ